MIPDLMRSSIPALITVAVVLWTLWIVVTAVAWKREKR